MAAQDAVVRIEREGPLALVVLDNPPVNAASQALRADLAATLEALAADASVEAVALHGAGRGFVAGADIREFGKPPAEPVLGAVCDAIEAFPKPLVAVIHGAALGGGLEIAMAAHGRVALPGATLGLPETTLGIIPGAGGTQRAPRLVGIGPALDLILSARRIGVEEALALGLVDRVAEGDIRAAALAAAEDARAGALPTRRAGDMTAAPDPAALDAARAGLTTRRPSLPAHAAAIEAVAAATGPLAAGLAAERRLFRECLETPERSALVHAFFAERAVAKIPEMGATPRPVERIGVVGGGTMGAGIAAAALLAGLQVALAERDEAACGKARETVAKALDGAVKRGKLAADRRDALLGEAFSTATGFDALADADVIVEAVFEDMDAKRDVFRRLDAAAKPGAILATNTSYLDVNAIAAETGRPESVLGLHFFSPAHVMRLLEVVVADRTAPETVATGFALAKRLGKVAVRAGVCDGFIGNRILSHYKKAADYLVLDGATPEQVDRAVEGYGFAMGPFAVADLAGLDIGWAQRKRLAPTRPAEERYVAVADRLCEAGRFGRKTGRGFYDYAEGGGRTPNPELDAILAAERKAAGVAPRAFSDAEIVDRFLTAMITEAARVVEDGVALRPSDVDAVFLFGYGFPRWKGGPMHEADRIGAAELVRRIEAWSAEDGYYWRVPPLLARLAAEGGSFAALDAAR